MSNKNENAKNILKGIFLGGAILVAASSPYFVSRALPKILEYTKYKIRNKKNRRSLCSTFCRLRKEGLIKIQNKNGQIYISLTKEGEKRAGKYKINDMKIEVPIRWDGKWRMLIFDIKDKQRIKREALRGKIKQLGLYQLQKSVWAYPYDFKNETDLLRSFFGLTQNEMQFIVANEVENDKELKKYFKVK